ncbi:uncharacterized protein LOC108668097, partial [Hyalella azteca]|uniref:Uncharacterized protein LOC108668097 n=1 Tax=Hyalella azteca TaxID=294128 RepID=A0A8B7NAZ4_HYAAZ
MVIAESCGVRCSRVMLLLYNTVFCLVGLTVGCVGLWSLSGQGWNILQALVPPAHSVMSGPQSAHPLKQPTSWTPTLQQLAHCLVVVGGAVVVTATLGCWATLTRSTCLLVLYLGLVV